MYRNRARIILLHLRPDGIRNGDAISVQVHGERSDHIRLGPDADCRSDRLAGEHVSAVDVAGDDIVEKDLPVRLGDDFHGETLVIKEAFFLGDNDGCAVGEFDEAEFQLVFFDGEFLGSNDAAAKSGG